MPRPERLDIHFFIINKKSINPLFRLSSGGSSSLFGSVKLKAHLTRQSLSQLIQVFLQHCLELLFCSCFESSYCRFGSVLPLISCH
jgi:hypothetical protein